MKYYVLLLFFVGFSFVNAQTYEGSIGKYPIYLELDVDYEDDNATAFYFYKSQLKQIDLKGTYKDSKLEIFTNDDDDIESFSLVLDDDKITGVWQKGNRQLNVKLKKGNTNLETFKRQTLAFVRDSITTHHNKSLVWLTEVHSKKISFRLGNGFNKSQREFVNKILDSIHTKNAIIALECNWADFRPEIELVSNQYLSFSETYELYCGGAHPNYGVQGYNFDLKNLKQLKLLTDLYPKLNHFELLKNKYQNDKDLQSECEYFDDKSHWDYYSWIITEKGLVVAPSYPHAMTPCEDGFVLTFKEIQSTE